MKAAQALYKKELVGYFQSPVAYVFLIVFLLSTVGTTFFLGRFFESGQASLEIFFLFHPWLYLFLVPAAGMGLWAEERSQGTLEILFTLPISLWGAVTAKFLAAWSFLGIALALTFPMVLTLWYLGSPDNGVMLAGYLGSFLMAGAYLQKDHPKSRRTLEKVYELFPVLEQRSPQIAGTLSGGEQQMLAIGRAFMSEPKLLCIDEPSTGLAPLVRREVFEKISEINRMGITILLVEQEVSLVFKMSCRNYVLSSGKIIAQGSGQQLLEDEVLRKTYLGL